MFWDFMSNWPGPPAFRANKTEEKNYYDIVTGKNRESLQIQDHANYQEFGQIR